MSTGFQAVKIAAVGFLIPFILVYYPSISLITHFQWEEFIWIVFRLPIAVWLVATGFIGCDKQALGFSARILRLIVAVLILMLDPLFQVMSTVVGLAIIFLHRITKFQW